MPALFKNVTKKKEKTTHFTISTAQPTNPSQIMVGHLRSTCNTWFDACRTFSDPMHSGWAILEKPRPRHKAKDVCSRHGGHYKERHDSFEENSALNGVHCTTTVANLKKLCNEHHSKRCFLQKADSAESRHEMKIMAALYYSRYFHHWSCLWRWTILLSCVALNFARRNKTYYAPTCCSSSRGTCINACSNSRQTGVTRVREFSDFDIKPWHCNYCEWTRNRKNPYGWGERSRSSVEFKFIPVASIFFTNVEGPDPFLPSNLLSLGKYTLGPMMGSGPWPS